MTTRGQQSLARRPRLLAPPILAALVILLPGSAAFGADPETSKLVVVLYPDESDGAPGIFLVNRAIRATFASQTHGHIDVRSEYVDTSRRRDAEFMRTHVSLLRQKYAGRKIDLVIAGLSSGLDFALDNREDLFPGVPIVFVAVDEREARTRRIPPDVIGVPIHMDLEGTLTVALRLHPETRRVFVIAGSAPFDIEWSEVARRTFRTHESRVEFTYLIGLPMDELLRRVADLPAQSIIYYLNIHRDGAAEPLIPAEALQRLAAKANVPIYGHADTYVGNGIVGGHVFSFEIEGQNAARLGLRILAGEKPESIAVPVNSANSYLFDGKQLRRWGISEELLPTGSDIRFKEPNFWVVYRRHIIGGISLCAVQAVLIVGLLVQRARRRQDAARFRQVVESAPTGMLMVGRDGKIALVNAQAESLFGYQASELLGQVVEVLVPDRARSEHGANRARFFMAAEARAMGKGRDLFGRRKDGQEFPVEIQLSPLQTPHGLFVVATIVDLTARRAAEDGLRASQRELRILTARLLEAQEAERRRLARELHDDVNQRLALLSIDMDLLAAASPESSEDFARRVSELSARVKELSSSVHGLSHQLHPSKLEQLGLVVVIRGLCKELSQCHGLEVTFTHYPEPGAIPDETALCLYRIVQEGLRNVVKHSRSRCAAVELTGSADTVRMRITDEGAGFDPATLNGGLGLVSMRERLHLIGGEIAIDSRPGGGTRIDVRIPVTPPSTRNLLPSRPAVKPERVL